MMLLNRRKHARGKLGVGSGKFNRTRHRHPNLEPHLREDIVDTREMQLYYLDQSKFPTRPCLLTPHSVSMIPVDLAEIQAALAPAT